MFQGQIGWFSSSWPLYGQAVDGTVVFQEGHLTEAWALTEPGWSALVWTGLGRKQLESTCTAGSGKGGAGRAGGKEHGLRVGARWGSLFNSPG